MTIQKYIFETLKLLVVIGVLILLFIFFYFSKLNLGQNENLLNTLIGSFSGVIFALIIDRFINKFKTFRIFDNWIKILKKELNSLQMELEEISKKMQKNNEQIKVNLDCKFLDNFFTSSDWVFFLKKEELITPLYNIKTYLKKIEKSTVICEDDIEVIQDNIKKFNII